MAPDDCAFQSTRIPEGMRDVAGQPLVIGPDVFQSTRIPEGMRDLHAVRRELTKETFQSTRIPEGMRDFSVARMPRQPNGFNPRASPRECATF